jgi:hypothetical protein
MLPSANPRKDLAPGELAGKPSSAYKGVKSNVLANAADQKRSRVLVIGSITAAHGKAEDKGAGMAVAVPKDIESLLDTLNARYFGKISRFTTAKRIFIKSQLLNVCASLEGREAKQCSDLKDGDKIFVSDGVAYDYVLKPIAPPPPPPPPPRPPHPHRTTATKGSKPGRASTDVKTLMTFKREMASENRYACLPRLPRLPRLLLLPLLCSP